MDEALVTVAEFATITEAYLAQSKLESEGIEVFVFDDNVAGLYASAIGGVNLKVRESEVARAREALEENVLQEDFSEAPPPAEEPPEIQAAPQCPRCLSSSVRKEDFPRKSIFFSSPVFPFLSRKKWVCQSCRHRW